MPTLKQIVEESDTPAGRAFALSIQGLIVLSLITFSIQTLPGLSESANWWLNLIELVTVGIFAFEYVVRASVARPWYRYVFSFFGIIDLVAILPAFLATGVDLRTLRTIRFLRMFRILKLARYSAAVRRFHRAFLIAREELIVFLITTLILLYVAAVGIYYFENEAQPVVFASIFHSLWWAVVTLTTVGYGDAYPITAGGRIFTFIILLLGLGVVAVPAGLLASALSKARQLEEEESEANQSASGTIDTEKPKPRVTR